MKKPSFLFGTGSMLLGLVVAFIAWAAWFELDQTVNASGQLIPQDRTQVIQVADGGVLQNLYVSEGQRVRAGEILATLEKQRANAAVDEIENRIVGLTVTKIRAEAEASNKVPNFGKYAKSHPDLVAAQRSLFQQNKLGLNEELASLKTQLALVNAEFNSTKRLFQSGDVSRLELSKIERQKIELQQKRDSLVAKYRIDARREITKMQEELTLQKSRMQERKSVLNHTDVIAPTDGVVKFLRINTLGGVLRAGDELMQISPEGDSIIEAKINPSDIGQLKIGTPVTVRVDAFDYTQYGALRGSLFYISSDTLTEQGPNEKVNLFYRAHIRLDAQQTNRKLALHQLKDGMTTTLDMQIGRRSVLQFIAKPIWRAFSGALSQK